MDRFVVGALGMGMALFGGAGTVAAQDRDGGREQVEIERSPSSRMSMVMTRRARLGVKVNLQARATDSIGAYVEGVTPGGPADKAGLRSGDVITGLDGASLLGGEGGSAERSLPGMRLIELAAKLEPNDTVKVDYRRGKDQRSAKLVTQEDPDNVFVFNGPADRRYTFRGPDGERGFAFGFGDMDAQLRSQLERAQVDMERIPRMMYMGGAEDLELVGLNPDLGSYFGTSEGVLVVRVPKDSPLGLKGGDVVQAIDGRKVTGPSQLHRILRTYDSEEAVKFDVMRNKRKETVSGKMAKRPEVQWRNFQRDSSRPRSRSSGRT